MPRADARGPHLHRNSTAIYHGPWPGTRKNGVINPVIGRAATDRGGAAGGRAAQPGPAARRVHARRHPRPPRDRITRRNRCAARTWRWERSVLLSLASLSAAPVADRIGSHRVSARLLQTFGGQIEPLASATASPASPPPPRRTGHPRGCTRLGGSSGCPCAGGSVHPSRHRTWPVCTRHHCTRARSARTRSSRPAGDPKVGTRRWG